MTGPMPGQTGVLVRARVFGLQFLLLLFKTTVTIDGVPTEVKWGEHFFPTPPGGHEVRVSFKYLWRQMGENAISIQVEPGQVVSVHYRSPFFIFMPGSIKVA
ncbi:MAG: hypothetical protein ACRD0Z_11140 [Acidimicrobiales bacterium]